MELRRYNDQVGSDVPDANTSLLPPRIEESLPERVNEPVTYAQIVRQDRVQVLPQVQSQPEEDIDFCLQTPVQQSPVPANYHYVNVSPQLTSGGSSISSGYVDLTLPPGTVQRRPTNGRPMSPETSF